jgi:hypothetical protein
MKRSITDTDYNKLLRKSVQNTQSGVSTGDQTRKQGEANEDVLETAFEKAQKFLCMILVSCCTTWSNQYADGQLDNRAL